MGIAVSLNLWGHEGPRNHADRMRTPQVAGCRRKLIKMHAGMHAVYDSRVGMLLGGVPALEANDVPYPRCTRFGYGSTTKLHTLLRCVLSSYIPYANAFWRRP